MRNCSTGFVLYKLPSWDAEHTPVLQPDTPRLRTLFGEISYASTGSPNMIALPPDPPPIIGRASVIDGDTLEVHGQRIRIWGIDAPEGRQTCTHRGQTYRCGAEAANQLSVFIGAQPVTCAPKGRPDRYGRIVARCEVTAPCEPTDDCVSFRRDLGGWMVGSGWALDFPRYSDGEHAEQEFDAREGRKGLWAGEFQMPWDWRAAR